jgi:hypothetical protein
MDQEFVASWAGKWLVKSAGVNSPSARKHEQERGREDAGLVGVMRREARVHRPMNTTSLHTIGQKFVAKLKNWPRTLFL